jgi:hypothetical protein
VDWHLFTEIAGFLALLIAGATGYGKLQQKVKDMGKTIEAHEMKLETHMRQLSDGQRDFGIIDTKLDNILSGQDKLEKRIEAVDLRLRGHCEDTK